MAQIEELLQQLIDLQKEEMRRTSHYRLMKFLGSTLPILLMIVFSIWGTYALYQSLADSMQNGSGIIDIQSLKDLGSQF